LKSTKNCTRCAGGSDQNTAESLDKIGFLRQTNEALSLKSNRLKPYGCPKGIHQFNMLRLG
jgi:hypothetical protein